MEFANYLDGATVLFLTDSPDAEHRIRARVPELSARFATSTEEAYAAFDSSVMVVVVSDSIPSDDADRYSRAVLSQNPFCQFVLLASSHPTKTTHATDYDETVRRPVAEDEFRSVLKRRLTVGVYCTLLHEYYSLSTKLVMIKQRREDAESSSDSSATSDEEDDVFEDVNDRLQQLEPLLRELEADLEDEEINDTTESVRRHKRYLAMTDDEGGSGSKYHPDTCPECGLAWGGDNRAIVGRGFTRLGAGVWRCSRCKEIVHGLHDSNQRVNRG